MGRADPVKGHDFAFSLGLAKLKVTGLNIAPEGVEALGWVSEEEKLKLLQTAKVLLVPSGYEGQPMVILEALAANCPIIASTNVPDLPDCIISIDLNDRDGWVKAIDQPITSGLLEAVKPHRIENVQKKWQRLYDEIIASNASTE
jgi:glycosyltransferase involved in cell wall biosynthesis